MPPWPGNNLPVSLTFAILFSNEKNKSPNWESKHTEKVNNNITVHDVLGSLSKFFFECFLEERETQKTTTLTTSTRTKSVYKEIRTTNCIRGCT